jgi:PAS domain S-box-containing protein
MSEQPKYKEFEQKIQSLEEELRKYMKTAEERIDSDQEFRTLYEEALNPIMVVDENGRYLRANKAALNFLECTLYELKEKEVWDWTPPGYEEQERAEHSPFLSRRTVETRYWVNGKIKTLMLNVIPLELQGKKVLYGIGQDITDLKRIENALRQSEEKFRGITERLFDVVFTTDREGNLTYLSPSAELIFQYRPEERMGGHFLDNVPESEHSRIVQLMKKVLEGEEIGIFETEARSRDGMPVRIQVNVSAIVEDDEIVGTLGVIRNVTRYREIEDQLRQSQKMEAIGTLAGGIAHDFNNILGIIIGNAELSMEDLPKDHICQENLEEIFKASLRAGDLVNQILTFSRKTESQLQPIQLGPMIKESLKLMRASIPKTIEIRQQIADNVDYINADPNRINQVLINICNNAHHAIGKRNGILEVVLENIDLTNGKTMQTYKDLSPGRYVKLRISDTGHGIEPDIIDRIFDPYFTTKKVDEGSGMGLSVVHGIIKEHEGVIRVNSEPGKGTSFIIFFPAIRHTRKKEEDLKKSLPIGKERILFVDDEESILSICGEQLKRLGYQLTTIENGQRALNEFRKNPHQFDLIITDQTMPKMEGVDLARAVREIRPNIPIILCSGYSDLLNDEEIKDSGISELLTKPIVKSQLADVVRKVLDQQKKEKTNVRILLIDDEELVRSVMKRILEHEGFKVVEASNGNEGLMIFRNDPTDLVITDLLMPEKDGMEIIIEIQKTYPNTKLIAVSGGGKIGAEHYLEMAERTGAMLTLRKPIDRKKLLDAVYKVL